MSTQPIWNTVAGSIGSYPCLAAFSFQFSATAVLPATTISYTLISGTLPVGVTFNSSTGILSGTPTLVTNSTVFTFVLRATDNLGNLRDRTFSLTTSGVSSPIFTTPTGTILTTLDSTWISLQIQYSNPIPTNEVTIRLIQGELPPGVEVNSYGLIRGYAAPPTINLNLGLVTSAAIAVSSNNITCTSTTGFTVGRPIVFTGTSFGGLIPSQTYYVHSVVDALTFTISTTAYGPILNLIDSVGNMTVTLPNLAVGEPTVQTYSFTLKLESSLGDDLQSYYITVANQNAPLSQGGPGYPANTRMPTIYNTRPPTYNIQADDINYGYYLLLDSLGDTYSPSQLAVIPQISSGDFFSFKVLGNDFDGNNLIYSFANLPLGLSGDVNTGWVTGTPVIANNNINQFSFSVSVSKAINPTIFTPYFNFSFIVSNNIVGEVNWITPTDLGQIYNGTVSINKVEATSDVSLLYRITSGSLPPDLVLLPNGEISGIVAYQPTSTLITQAGIITPFTFTIQAYSPQFSVVQSSQTFTLSVYQEYLEPTDTVYIKCVPSVNDRNLIQSLLTNTTLIPTEYLYRPNDPYFGKASSVIYDHAYGIYASTFEQYVEAITTNHYWRKVTLGEIKTAVARDSTGTIIYEVVYSHIIDNLVNPDGISLSDSITWPRKIPLNLGPWYDSETNIYTSYNLPDYYTSLDTGSAVTLYPNGLVNMRNTLSNNLGQVYNSNLLPLWMTSQQNDGSTLGFTPAWVICYTLPGYSSIIQNNIQNNWVNSITGTNYVLNSVNFTIDRLTVNKDITYNFDTNVSPSAWTGLPSASPALNPLDSDDFSVIFPRKTILPNSSN